VEPEITPVTATRQPHRKIEARRSITKPNKQKDKKGRTLRCSIRQNLDGKKKGVQTDTTKQLAIRECLMAGLGERGPNALRLCSGEGTLIAFCQALEEKRQQNVAMALEPAKGANTGIRTNR